MSNNKLKFIKMMENKLNHQKTILLQRKKDLEENYVIQQKAINKEIEEVDKQIEALQGLININKKTTDYKTVISVSFKPEDSKLYDYIWSENHGVKVGDIVSVETRYNTNKTIKAFVKEIKIIDINALDFNLKHAYLYEEKNEEEYWIDKNTFVVAIPGNFDENGDEFIYLYEYQIDTRKFCFNKVFEYNIVPCTFSIAEEAVIKNKILSKLNLLKNKS